MEELWKAIPGQENRYEVSTLGNVRSVNIKVVAAQYGRYPYERNIKGRVLKPYITQTGYKRVRFLDPITKKGHGYFNHRLVALAFIPNLNNWPQVNHIDGNKLNNELSNLEWATQSTNTQHAYDTGLLKPASNRQGMCGDLNKTNKHVEQYDLQGKFIAEYESISLTKKQGFIPSCVGRVAQGLLKQHKGYFWKYPTI